MLGKNKLTAGQKEAIGLLSIGTVLEYFDLMLYIHMAVLLNELFFPKTDPITTKLLIATTYSITFIIRPIGGIIIGWIGDMIGRKSTIILTTTIMAFCCLAMATLPTYVEIGITATIVMIICRMLQGFSSLGECIGTKLYLVEILRSPHRGVFVGLIGTFIGFGGLLALVVAKFSTSIAYNWRVAFGIGALIAIIGMLARTRLKETPEFIDYKRRMESRSIINSSKDFTEVIQADKKIDKKVVFLYFSTEVVLEFPFYIAFIFMGDFMKNKLNFSAEEVISQNLYLCLLTVSFSALAAIFAKTYHPLKIGFTTTIIFSIILFFIPFWLNNVSNNISLLLLQLSVFFLLIPGAGLLEAVFFRYFPVSRRFRFVATTFGFASPIGKVIISFGLIPIINYFGNYGIWFFLVPAAIIVFVAINYFKKLEKERGGGMIIIQKRICHMMIQQKRKKNLNMMI